MGTEERKIFIGFEYVSVFVAIIIAYFFYSILKQQKKFRKLQKEKLHAEINAAEIIRQQIATELHNDIGPFLSGIRMRLQQIQTSQKELQYECMDALDKSVIQIRKLAKGLSPLSVFEISFQDAIKNYIRTVNVSGTLKIDYIEKALIPLTEDQSSQIYRIMQEIILNAVKHSGGTELIIEISREDDKMLIRTSDDGVGFDMEALRTSNQLGLGLLGIQSRIDYLNGTVSSPEDNTKGTKYNIRIPIIKQAKKESTDSSNSNNHNNLTHPNNSTNQTNPTNFTNHPTNDSTIETDQKGASAL